MRAIICTGVLKETVYDITVTKSFLIFASENTKIKIPIKSLKQFSVYGKAENPNQFMLTTSEAVYHGYFTVMEDMQQMMDALKSAVGQKIEINLNMCYFP